jgi:DNA-directed RNA polymerase subunit A"
MEDKGLTVDDVVQKLQHRRRQKVIADGYNVFVQSEKEEPILQDLQKLAEKVKEIPLKGLKGVSRAMIKVERNGDGEGDWEYYIRCEGSNFTGALRIPGVDSTRTTTNHIHEIAETLGIEAARAAIIREAKKVLDDQGLDVDIRHITLVADLMTHTGDIHQIGRHGVSGEKSSVFARAAFEVTVKHLLDAAIYGQRERLQGIVENVIVGQAIRLGTGIVDLAISPNYREFAEKPIKPVS